MKCVQIRDSWEALSVVTWPGSAPDSTRLLRVRCRFGRDQVSGKGCPRSRRARGDTELGEEAGDMAIHGADTDEEGVGDFAVGAAFGEEDEDIPFPLGQGSIRAGERLSA